MNTSSGGAPLKVLAIDCATEHCSAALWLSGEVLERSAPPARGLSEHLLQWVEELLAAAGLGLRGLDLVAFGRGPGAFTGVRLATSLAQGLAIAADLPVAPVSTLRSVAAQALALRPTAAAALVCQDARMHELYWARYERRGHDAVLLDDERLDAPDGVHVDTGGAIVAAGSGFDAYAELAQRWGARRDAEPALALPLQCAPRARDIARLAALDGLARAVAAADALPVYLRDNVASPAPPPAL